MKKYLAVTSLVILALIIGVVGYAAAQEGDAPRPWVGIQIEDVENGVRVVEVLPDSPAAAAELQADDVITAVGETSVATGDELVAALSELAVGDDVTLSVIRGEETLEVQVTLGTMPEPVAIEMGEVGRVRGGVMLGVNYHPVDEAFAANLGLNVTSGALILNVMPESSAAKADLQAGDIITAVDGIAVDEERALSDLISDFEEGDVVPLTVIRAGAEQTIEVTLEAGMFDMPFHGGQGMPFFFEMAPNGGERGGEGFRFNFGDDGQGMQGNNRNFEFRFDGNGGTMNIPFDFQGFRDLIPEGALEGSVVCTDENGEEVFSFSFDGDFQNNIPRGNREGRGLDFGNLNCEFQEGASDGDL